MEAAVGGSADAGPSQAQVGSHIVVRSVGGEWEWHVPDIHGDLMALALKQHLVTHGGVSRLDQPVLLAGSNPLKSMETVRTALADSHEGHVTLVRCGRSWLADERAILAAKYLKAVLHDVLSPTNSNFDVRWTAAGALEVGPEQLEELLQHAVCTEDLALSQEPSMQDFLILLGTLLQSYRQWRYLSVQLCQHFCPGIQELPRLIARCAIHWALVFATPGDVDDSWPFILPSLSPEGHVEGASFYRPPGCDFGARVGKNLEAVLRLNDAPAIELEGVDRALFCRSGRGLPDGTVLTARTALTALRVRTRVAAGLPVVLLGDFLAREDVEVCEIARQLLRCPELREHEVAELPGDFRLPSDTRALEEHPLTLLRARGDVQDARRLAHLAAAAGAWSPSTVWSVSTRGTTQERALSMLPRAFGEAAAISL